MQIVISIDGFSVTIHAPFPSGGLWEARKRIESALRPSSEEPQNTRGPRP